MEDFIYTAAKWFIYAGWSFGSLAVIGLFIQRRLDIYNHPNRICPPL